MEFSRGTEIAETKNPESKGYREIKPESDMTVKEARGFWDKVFGNMIGREVTDVEKEYYSSYDERLKRTPIENGYYEGERGESKFVPSDTTERGRAAIEKLSEKGLDGIEYKNAEPDFSKCAEVTVQIENMTENRLDYIDSDKKYQKGNFSQANIKCAEQWNIMTKDGKSDWNEQSVEQYRKNNNLSWHECADTKTMHLIPSEIHTFFSHTGGVFECKIRDALTNGGGFDE